MAGFQNQFTISLELSSVIPQAALAIGKTYNAAMKFARELQSSGSDIVIEEDLTLLLGRCRLAPNLASSFRAVVSQTDLLSPVMATIALVSGPGPTLLRALTQPASESPFFTMVVQCSLLVAVHEPKSLAVALARTMERETDGAPDSFDSRSIPSIEGIRGVLRAIEDQSSSFDWRKLLLSVARQLDLPDEEIHQTIPPTIFQCLATMLSSVQRFPEERSLDIQTHCAACVIIVWAHHVLGLSVLVTISTLTGSKTTRFGTSPEQVSLHLTPRNFNRLPAATLLSADGSILFILKEEPGEEQIDGACKGPAKGYCKRILEQHISRQPNRDALIDDVAAMAIAMAIVLNQKMRIAKPSEESGIITEDYMPSTIPSQNPITDHPDQHHQTSQTTSEEDKEGCMGDIYRVDIERLRESAKFLFKPRTENFSTVDSYVKFFAGVPLYEIEEPPGPTSSILRSWNTLDSLWSNLRFYTISLSIIVFAFAHVLDHSTCSDVPWYEDVAVMRSTSLTKRLSPWDGSSELGITSDDCFEVISCLMLGEFHQQDLSRVCLVSARGWSLFVSTITEADPARVVKGALSIRKGVPCRNNVWKHFISDQQAASVMTDLYYWEVEARPGSEISVCNMSPVQYGKPFCGESGDSFLVSIRFHHASRERGEEYTVRRTGYDELNYALWLSRHTQPCNHVLDTYNKLVLPPGCVTVSGFGDLGGLELGTKTYICLTSGSRASRWRALLAVASCSRDDEPLPTVLLKDLDCCLCCAVGQALAANRTCFLIL